MTFDYKSEFNSHGGFLMTNLEELKRAIQNSGIPITIISKRTHMNRRSLYNKINGKTEFKVSEMDSLSKVIGLNEKKKSEIFFAE